MRRALSLALASALAVEAARAQTLQVVATDPPRHAGSVAPGGDVTLDFDRALAPSALPPAGAAFRIAGSESGPAAGTYTLENNGLRVRFVPAAPFFHGETVTVAISHDLAALDGTPMRSAGFVQRHVIGVTAASPDFQLAATYDLRLPTGNQVRIYGGQTADVDDDGWVDLAIVNEVSSDIRVMLNRADGSGLFHQHLMPANPVGSTPSPNHSADLDGDGFIDLVTANTGATTVSVVLGNGDGTFAPRVDYQIGGNPHGLALLDVDGDGDLDIAGASPNTGVVGIRRNDGSGVFGGLTTFDGGNSGEYGLAAGDMNEDGIDDLVVGLRYSERVAVHLGNGDGTFTPAANVSCGGGVWMIVLGDVDGDGHVDVTTANGGSASGSILLGDGAGGLSLAQLEPTTGFSTATDLGDVDGDGDLDWMVSEFGGGRWELHENDGIGHFTLLETFFAPSNPGCSLIFDADKDGDLDLALLDEIADVVQLYLSRAPGEIVCAGDGTSGLACPCGNDSTAGLGHGCTNATGTAAVIVGSGSTSAAADDLVLATTGMNPGTFGLTFMGSAAAAPVAVNNGLVCAGGALFRYPVFATGLGRAEIGPGLVSLTQASNPPAGRITAGSTWRFQTWYRDVGPHCAGLSNYSSTYRVTFTP